MRSNVPDLVANDLGSPDQNHPVGAGDWGDRQEWGEVQRQGEGYAPGGVEQRRFGDLVQTIYRELRRSI